MLPHNLPSEFGSKNEEYVYYALVKYELPFDYQVPILGGTSQRGGIVLDFLVYNPFKTAVPVHGNYWHRANLSSDEQYALGVLIQRFDNRVVVLWGDETDTPEEAEHAVRTWLIERPGSSKY